MVPTLLYYINTDWREQGGESTSIMNYRFFYYLFVLLVLLSACNQNQSNYKVTHIPYKADKDSRWGLIDWEGNPLIEDEFTEKPSVVIEDRFYVKNSGGLYEFYTAEKKFKKIGKEYLRVGAFRDGLAPVVEKDQPVSFIRLDGTVAFTFDSYKDETVQAVSIFQEGRALFMTNSGKYGYIDVNGRIVIEPIYDNASLFYNNSALVYKAQNGEPRETLLINKDGVEYFKVNPDNSVQLLLSEHKVPYSEKIDGKNACGILNEHGEKILKASVKYGNILPFYNGYATYQNQSYEYGLIDKKGNVIIRPKYTNLLVSEDVLLYEKDGKFGLVSYNGDKISDAIYKEILPFQPNNKYTYALDNNEWILIDKNGKDIHRNSFHNIACTEYPGNPLLAFTKSILPAQYGFLVESDYVNIQAEVDKVMKYINEDGSIDKLTYNTAPGEFVDIYDKDYKVSDLKDEEWMFQSLQAERFILPSLGVKYNANVITPSYERKWKESYWGGGHWENEVAGYSYNNNLKIETFRFILEPTGKLVDRKQEMFDAVCLWMETRGYTKLSTNNNNEEKISVYWEKKTPLFIKAGVHFTKDYVVIVIGKE